MLLTNRFTTLAREFEMHFKAVRQGELRNIRKALARKGVQHFQRAVYRRHGKWIPKRKIRVSFEREEKARKAQRDMSVDGRTMRYLGKHHRATALPSRVISYGKRKRRRSSKRRCA